MKETASLEKLADQLMTQKGLTEGVSSEVQAEIKKDLMNKMEETINTMIVSEIPAEKLPDFEKLVDQNDEASIREFVEKNIENLPEKLASALFLFRDTYLGDE